jgi:predicted nucleic acid-binding protein
VIYLDSSALVKLIFEESESPALAEWLDDRHDVPKLSSEVATVELVRTCRRYNLDAVADARQLLAGLDLVVLSGEVIHAAAESGPAELRSLDAIHLASALSVADDLVAFVAYDHRLADAANQAGLPVASPA